MFFADISRETVRNIFYIRRSDTSYMDNHRRKPWHAKTVEEVYSEFMTSDNGLSDAEAKKRLQQNGRNELRRKPPKSVWQMLKEQISDPMVLILLGAAGFSALLNEWTEAAVIGAIVVINAIIGIVQEKKAQSSIESLRGISAPTAKVLRQGEESVVLANELVVGDIVLLSDGDMVPADMRLTKTANLKIQEASLTGESLPTEKDADDILSEECVLGDRGNMAYSSSIVTYGRGEGVVVATGMDTEVGNIAGLLDRQSDFDTPMKRKLNAVGKTLTIIGIIVCVLIFLIGLIYQRPLVPQFLVAVSLAISIIPEGLPATATIVMALAVQRMAKKNALIRKLPAVETLGSATVICSDKTGTLTLNKMTVTQIATFGNDKTESPINIEDAVRFSSSVQKELVYAAALCNDASFDPDREGEIIGDPTEGALLYMVRAFGENHEGLEEKYPRVFEQPFDSERKRMTSVHDVGGGYVAYTKGAVDEMIDLCSYLYTEKGVVPLTDEKKKRILTVCGKMSQNALRVLGFSLKNLTTIPDEDADLETDMTFIGVVGMIDPPRKEVAESVRVCRDAGIRTVMITGDHKVTALAIAKELGIYRHGDSVIGGEELDRMSDTELDAVVKSVSVFSRVSPSDKLRIIQSLKRNGEVAAMTGDGVNDSPALKEADIGVAMGVTGTDVAKDAADMILLDDSFTTIAYAIREGRRVYRNIQKVIQFLLAGNIAEILTLFIATLFNWDAPLLAIHILWVNLATATLPALALGVDPASKNIMKHPPVKSGTLFEKDLIKRVVTQGVFVSVLTICAYWIGSGVYLDHSVGRTMAFCVLAFSQMLRAFNQRSNTEPVWIRAEGHNPWLILSFFVSAALMAVILFIPIFQTAFKVTYLSGIQWVWVAGLSLLSVVQIEVIKFFRKLNNRKLRIK